MRTFTSSKKYSYFSKKFCQTSARRTGPGLYWRMCFSASTLGWKCSVNVQDHVVYLNAVLFFCCCYCYWYSYKYYCCCVCCFNHQFTIIFIHLPLLLLLFVVSVCCSCRGWGQSAKLGKHSAICSKLGTALQAHTLSLCTKFAANPTSRKVNT